MALAPLALVVPILTAAVLVGIGGRIPASAANGIALVATLATATLCAVLLGHVWDGNEVAWMGGWHPRAGGVVIEIDLAVDPLGAGAATFSAVLVALALIYSQRYFEEIAPLYHALLLVMLTGIVGLCLTGDLFDLFVFFELMSVPSYVLTAYDIEEKGPIQGALAFALTNSIGSFMMVSGIGLLYGRTGALNLAQIGHTLAGHQADGLVVAAFALIACGFLIKAAAVPFHFWLPDAYAVAPVPVCILFAGVMLELGLFGLARVYWTAFAGIPGMGPHRAGDVLLWLGVLTAVVGAVMAIMQHHLKRLLAFSTISHGGLFLMGFALLGAHALGGVAVFVLAHGAVNSSMFMAAGIVGRRVGTVAEADLHGRARGLRVTGIALAVGGLAIASLPPFGPFAGKALVEEAATARGLGWFPALFALCTALTGGAILRVAARAFLGLGPRAPSGDPGVEEEAEEEHAGADWRSTPLQLSAPMVGLLLAGLGVGLVPEVRHALDHAAAVFVDRPAVTAQVLAGGPPPHPHVAPATGPHLSSYLYAAVSVLGALLTAGVALFSPRREGLPVAARAARLLHAWHDGHLGDYATWAAVGAAVLGWAVAVSVR
jgi:multicomponent Na+:H+ antiporter subunit D